MDTTYHTVTLKNGKQVLWDEFATWSSDRQNSNLNLKELSGERKHKAWNLSESLLHSSNCKDSLLKKRKVTRNIGASNGSSKVVMTPKESLQKPVDSDRGMIKSRYETDYLCR